MTSSELISRLAARKGAFFLVFFVTVLVTYGVLYWLDIYPEPISEESEEVIQATTTVYEEVIEPVAEPYPVLLTFDKLNKSIAVLNPTSRAIADLDEALLSGAVRHPDSATFSVPGNMFILGHSSYLPNVFNKNFQAFNGIQNLAWGDKVRVQSADTEYVYRVERVYEAKAAEVIVPVTEGEATLTLATCNSFGAKDDRFIVEAVLIGSYALETVSSLTTS